MLGFHFACSFFGAFKQVGFVFLILRKKKVVGKTEHYETAKSDLPTTDVKRHENHYFGHFYRFLAPDLQSCF